MWLRQLLAPLGSVYALRGTSLLPEHLEIMLRGLGVPESYIRVTTVGGDADPETSAARKMGLLGTRGSGKGARRVQVSDSHTVDNGGKQGVDKRRRLR